MDSAPGLAPAGLGTLGLTAGDSCATAAEGIVPREGHQSGAVARGSHPFSRSHSVVHSQTSLQSDQVLAGPLSTITHQNSLAVVISKLFSAIEAVLLLLWFCHRVLSTGRETTIND